MTIMRAAAGTQHQQLCPVRFGVHLRAGFVQADCNPGVAGTQAVAPHPQ